MYLPISREKTCGCLLSALLLAAGPALVPDAAADATAYTEMTLRELMDLEVFSAASKMPTELTRAPGTVYSFSRGDFERFGVRRLEDLLQFVPGFQLNQYRKRHRSIWARGSIDRYNDKLVLVVDGIQRRHLYYNHFALGDNFPLEKIDRVEIILGPASSLYGANAFGGIISVTTRAFAATRGGEVTAEVGDNARIKGTALANSDTIQAFASYLDQEAAFDPDRSSFIGGESLQETDEQYRNLYLKATPLPGLTLALDYYDNETPFLFIPATQDAYIEERPLTLAASYARGDVAGGRLEADLHYTRDEQREYEIEQTTRALAYTEQQDAEIYGANLTLFREFGGAHQLALGGTWQHSHASDMNYIRYWHYRDGFLATPDAGSLLSDAGFHNDDLAVFLQDVWQLSDSLTLTLSGRQDFYESFEDRFNYRAAAVWSPVPRQVVKAMYGTASRVPSTREYLKVLEGTDFVPPVPEPESLESLEFNYLYQWDNANIGLTLFRNTFDDYIYEQPTPDDADEYFTNSDDPWRMWGSELLVQARPHERLHLRVGLAYLNAENNDGTLPYLAEWSGSVNLDYRLSGSHRLGLSAIYNAEREDTNDYPDDDSGAFTILNLHARGELAPRLGYAIGVDNLLDETVYDPAGDFGSQHNTERSQREIWARLNYRFGD